MNVRWSSLRQQFDSNSVKFYQNNLKMFKIKNPNVVFGDKVNFVDLEFIDVCFPNLKYLALIYGFRDDFNDIVLQYSL